ncbi:MAG: hypothetical protein HYS44_03700 [Candidatus Niyogibacteria bacterium]|nr:hypothetical protein [Candidatus Niyogibacteria bacterium]
MPHISRKHVKRDVFLRMNDRFIRSVINLGDQKSASSFLKELLTSTEQIMLAKRLAVIFMLQHHCSFYRIERVLKISPSTAARLWRKMEAGEFSHICALMRNEKQKRAFWTKMETLLRMGMPPMGRGRWKWFYDLQRESQR